jgi:DNA adenine methylase
MKPPFAYYGGKTVLAQRIVAQLPPHHHYVEPFGGSLAVLLAKPPSAMETVNDLDGDLMLFFRMLRDRPEKLIRACALTPHSRGEHDASYNHEDCDELERARRTWVTLSQGRAGVLRRTGWRHYIDPAGSSASMPDYLAAYVDRMGAVAERLAGVSLECRPALDVISRYGAEPDVLLYVDPPYLGSTRGWGNNYRREMRGDDEHRELAEALHAARAAVVLSGYHSPLYTELFRDWYTTRLPGFTGQAKTYGARTEVLWSNRPGELDLFGSAA